MAKDKKINHNRHAAQCDICKHPRRADIELDYTHCIPWAIICERYPKISDPQIERHAIALGLNKKRDRKAFYWKLIEKVPLEKMTVENAIEAAKQLDRIERVIVDNPTPSNIQVVYSFGRPVGSDTGKIDSKNRLSPVADAVKVPPVREEIPPL